METMALYQNNCYNIYQKSLSQFQKQECYFCKENDATHEFAYLESLPHIQIRCCDDPVCQNEIYYYVKTIVLKRIIQ